MRQFFARWWRTDPLEKFERETRPEDSVRIGLHVTLTGIGYNVNIRGYVSEMWEEGDRMAYVVRTLPDAQ